MLGIRMGVFTVSELFLFQGGLGYFRVTHIKGGNASCSCHVIHIGLAIHSTAVTTISLIYVVPIKQSMHKGQTTSG